MRTPSFTNLNSILTVVFVTTWHTSLPLVPVYAEARGAGPVIIGLIVSSNVVLPLLMALPLGIAADRLGTRWVSRISALVMAASYVLVVASPTLGALALALTAVGFADVGLIVSAQTHVAKTSTDADRDRHFAQFAVHVSVGALIGPVLGGAMADAWGYRAAFMGSLVLALITLVLTGFLREPKPSGGRLRDLGPAGAQAARQAGALLRDPGLSLVLAVSAAVMIATCVRQSFLPLYLKDVGLSTTLIGVVLSCYSAFQILIRPTLEISVRHLGHVGVLSAALASIVLGVAVVPYLESLWPLVVAMSLVAAGTGFTQPLTMSLVSGRVSASTRGLAIGLRQTANQVAQIASPPLLGLVVGSFGLAAAFPVAAGLGACGLVALWRLARYPSSPSARQSRANDSG
jgi:MFS family permease